MPQPGIRRNRTTLSATQLLFSRAALPAAQTAVTPAKGGVGCGRAVLVTVTGTVETAL